MAVAETFFRRLTVEMKRSSEPGVTRLLNDSESGVKWVIPVDVHLEKGSKAVSIPLAATVEGTPARALVALKTSRPGVQVRVGQLGTNPDCRTSGTLLSVSDNIYDDWNGVATQDEYWEIGKWSSVPNYPLTSEEDSNWAHEVVEATGQSGLTTIDALACWGSSYLNLGEQNDGKIFQFWVKMPFSYSGETLSSAAIQLSSYPYGDTTHDGDIVGGGTDDPNIVAVADPEFEFQFYSTSGARQLIEDDTWSMVTARKEAFANTSGSTGQPLWSRITGLRFRASYTGVVVGAAMRVGSVYFGDRLEAALDTVMIQPFLPTASVPLVLSLDGPSDGPADVSGMVLIK